MPHSHTSGVLAAVAAVVVVFLVCAVMFVISVVVDNLVLFFLLRLQLELNYSSLVQFCHILSVFYELLAPESRNFFVSLSKLVAPSSCECLRPFDHRRSCLVLVLVAVVAGGLLSEATRAPLANSPRWGIR